MVVGMLLQTIKEKYWYMNLEEIAFVLQKGMLGFYKTYGKLTAADIMEWIHIYDTTERDEYCQTEALKHKEPYEKQDHEIKRKEAQQFDELYKKQVKFNKAKEKAKALK